VKIKEILSQSRRDFRAIFICEHCSCEESSNGYDDEYFHSQVLPNMKCKNCFKKSPENYRALTTKYPEWQSV
jgi:hypothetical protein